MSRWGLALASALLVAACGGSAAPPTPAASATPQGKAERVVRNTAAQQRVSLTSVHCSPSGRGAYACNGRTSSGGTYSCGVSVSAKGRDEGACFFGSRS